MTHNFHNSDLPDAPVEAMIKKVTLIFYAMMAGIILFLLVMAYQVEILKIPVSPSLHTTLQLVVPAIALMGIIGGKFITSILIKQAAADSGNNQLMKYQTACIVKYALFEGPSLLCIVAYFLTGNGQYVIILAIILILMLLGRPSVSRFREDMANKG